MCGSLATRTAIVVLILAGAATSASAQGDFPEAWVGKRVILKLGVCLTIADRPVDSHDMYHVYRVVRAEAGVLWLESEYRWDVKGYAQACDLVPRDAAIAYYTRLIQARPAEAQAYLLRGHHRRVDRKDLPGAIEDYTRAIELDPSWSSARDSRGNAWYAQHEYDRAIEDYDAAIAVAPGDLWPYNNRGNAWRKKGDYARAVSDWDEAERIDPDNPLPYANQAWLAATCPDPAFRDGKKAVKLAARACALAHGRDEFCVEALAAGYAECGDFAHAIAYQKRAVALCVNKLDRKNALERLAAYRSRKPCRDRAS